MAAVPPDIRQRKYRVICRLGHPVLNSQYELYPGVTLLPFYTFPPSHPRPLSRTSLCPSVPLLSRPPFPWAYLSWRAASSPAGSAFSLQPGSFLPRSEFPPSCSNQLKSRPPPHRGWRNHNKPRSMVPRSFAVVAPVGLLGGMCLSLLSVVLTSPFPPSQFSPVFQRGCWAPWVQRQGVTIFPCSLSWCSVEHRCSVNARLLMNHYLLVIKHGRVSVSRTL